MAQIKVKGAQVDIQDVANDIGNDAVAISSIATGLNSDPTMDANYLRLDGTVPMGGNLDLGANNLITTGTVDGRDVATDGTAQDTHIADATLHFTEASIDHIAIANVGTNTHVQIDNHVADATLHRIINDAGTTATELFSANEIISRLAGKSDTSHTHAIGTLSDVNVGGAVSGQALSFDGANWINSVVILTGSSQSTGGIDVFSAITGSDLEFNGVAAGAGGEISVTLDGPNNNVVVDANPVTIAGGFAIGDVSDVTLASTAINDYLRWNGTDWVNTAFAASVTSELNTNSIDELIDVDTTTSAPAISEVLTWDGSNWTPSVNPSGVTTFTALTDTPTVYGTDQNQFVMVNSTPNGLIFVPANLDNLFDVDTTTAPPNTNEVLAYNGTDWVPQDGSVKTFYKAVKSTVGTLNVGDPVYIVGHDGTYITVELADASAGSSMPAVGVVGATVTDAAAGNIVTSGVVSGFDTSSWSVGAEVYISAAGGLVSPAPASESNQIQKVGEVLIQNATTGAIHVVGAGRSNSVSNLDNGNFFIGNGSNQTTTASFATSVTSELGNNSIDALSDVVITTAAVNEGLVFVGGNWINQVIDHTTLANIGTNTHAQIDTHIADATLHFTESNISHLNIQDIGTNSHALIDSHIADATIHFVEASIDHLNIQNKGTNTHAQIDNHIAGTGSKHTAADIINVPTGSPGVGATDVQAAIDELNTEKAPVASPVFTGVPVLPPYLLASLPTVVEGGMIFVTDANAGAGAMCYGQIFGSPDLWIDVTTGIAVV